MKRPVAMSCLDLRGVVRRCERDEGGEKQSVKGCFGAETARGEDGVEVLGRELGRFGG